MTAVHNQFKALYLLWLSSITPIASIIEACVGSIAIGFLLILVCAPNISNSQCSGSQIEITIQYDAFCGNQDNDGIKLFDAATGEELFCESSLGSNSTISVCLETGLQVNVYGYDDIGQNWCEAGIIISSTEDGSLNCGSSNELLLSYFGAFDGSGVALCNRMNEFDELIGEFTVPECSGASISGQITTCMDQPLENVIVTVNTDQPQFPFTDFTNINGEYEFTNNPAGLDYEIIASLEDSEANCGCGVNTLDLILMRRFIFGISNQFDSPFKMIAADVNNDNQFNTIDVIELSKLIRGIYSEFPQNDCFRFAVEDQELDVFNPFEFSEVISIENLLSDTSGQNFIGISIGDVDGSCLQNPDYTGEIILEADDEEVLTGQTVEVEISSNNFNDVAGMQFTLSHSGLDLLDVVSGDLEITTLNYTIINEGTETTFSWYPGDLSPVSTNDVLFKLLLQASENVKLSDVLDINSNLTTAEAYTADNITVQEFLLNHVDLKIGQDSCINNVMHFDGIDDRITAMSPLEGNTDYTISLDFKCGTQGFGRYNRLIGFSNFETEIAIRDDELSFYNGSLWRDSEVGVTDSIWHNATLVRQGSIHNLYLDGSNVFTFPGPTTLDFTGNIIVGHKHNVNGTGEYFLGIIDNVKVWDRALSPNEVCDNVTTGLIPNALYFDFEEGIAEEDNTPLLGPLDLIGNDNNGTFNNFKLEGRSSNYLCDNVNVSPNCNLLSCDNTVMNFDGVDDNISLIGIGTETDFTIGIWFKVGVNNGGAEDRLFGFGNIIRLEMGITNSGNLWRHDGNVGGIETYDNIRDDQWHHLAVVAEGSNRKLYLDFNLIDNYDSGPPVYGPNLRIGSWAPGPTLETLFSGELDEFRGYDIAISEENICNVFNKIPADINPNLRMYFDFEDGKGEADNQGLSSVVNQGDLIDGNLEGFQLQGKTSNYVCGSYDLNDCDESENSVMQFDGSDDKIIANSPLSGNSDYTVSIDFKCEPQTGGFGSRYARLLGTTNFETEIGIKTTELSYNGGGNWVDSGINVTDNTWHNVTLVRKENMNILFLDGDIILCQAGPSTLNFGGSLFLGHKQNNNNSEFFRGFIDNVKIWDFSLSNSEVCENVTSGLVPNVLFYNFEEGVGGQDNSGISGPMDLSGKGNNGVFNNFGLSGMVSNYINDNPNFEVDCEDITPPDFNCDFNWPDFTIDENGVASRDLIIFDLGVEEFCGTYSVMPPAFNFTCDDLKLMGDPQIYSTIIVSDEAGNTSQCAVEIIVNDPNNYCDLCSEDTEPPFTQDCSQTSASLITIELDSNGESFVTYENWDIEVTDNCSEVIGPEINYTADCDDVGLELYWDEVLTDESGNSAPCQLGIAVTDPNNYCECLNDNTPPTLACPTETLTVELGADGMELIDHLFFIIAFSDNCSENMEFSGSIEANCDLVGQGEQMFVVVATDEQGNSSTCELSFEVSDTSPVMIENCEIIFKTITVNGDVTVDPLDANPIVNENCDYQLSLGKTIFDCSDLGFSEYFLYAEDNLGNIDSCSNIIQIVDPAAFCDFECNITFSQETTEPCYTLNLTSEIDGFLDSEFYSWTLDNNFISESNNLSYSVSGPGIYEVCLTVSNQQCSDIFCDIFIFDPVFPVIGNCPSSNIELTADEYCLQAVSSSDLYIEFSCEVGEVPISEIKFARSDGKDINEPYTVGGRTLVTGSYTDGYGFTSLCQYYVDIIDEESPTIIDCSELSLELDINGNAILTIDDIDYDARDNCGITNVIVDQQNFSCTDLGILFYSMTVFDEAGNEDNCQNVVLIVDLLPPVIEDCSSALIFFNEFGEAELSVGDINVVAEDNCSTIEYGIQLPEIRCDQGAVSENYLLIATDEAGNSSTCNNTLSVSDVIEPSCSIESRIEIILDDNGQASIDINSLPISATDNCQILSTQIISVNAFDCSDIGINSVSVQVEDVSGNQSNCLGEILIIDNTDPQCDEISGLIIELESNGQAIFDPLILNGQVTDNCEVSISEVSQTLFSCNDLGNNIISFSAVDASGNVTLCETEINVNGVDLNAEWNANVTGCRAYNFTPDVNSYTSYMWDFGDGNASSSINPDHIYENNGGYNVCLTVEANGCSSTSCQNLNVDFNCDGCSIVFNYVQDCYKVNFTSSDFEYAGTVSYTWLIDDVVVSSNSDYSFSSGTGTYEACLTASDEFCSNTYCESFSIQEVVPILSDCPTETIQLVVNETCDPVFYNANVDVAFFCENESIDPLGFQVIRSDSELIDAPYGIGITSINMSYTDGYGVSSECNYQVEVIDEIGPICLPLDSVIILDIDGLASLNSNQLNNSNFDACGSVGIVEMLWNFDCADLGEQELDYIIVDESGNSAECEAVIVIIDETGPSCPQDTLVLVLSELGTADLDFSLVAAMTSDNCSEVLFPNENISFSCEDLGESVIEYIINDESDNSALCTSTALVEDVSSPICVVKDLVLSADENDQAFVVFEYNLSDNCGTPEVTFSSPDNQLYDCGEYTVILIAEDVSGNIAECTFSISVDNCAACCRNNDVFMTMTNTPFLLIANDNIDGTCGVILSQPFASECTFISEVLWGDSTEFRGFLTSVSEIKHSYLEPGDITICVTYEEQREESSTCFTNQVCESLTLTNSCDLRRSRGGSVAAIELRLWPNPTTNVVNVKLPELYQHQEISDLKCYNLNGQAFNLKTVKLANNNAQTDFSNLPQGIYLISVELESGILLASKVVKI